MTPHQILIVAIRLIAIALFLNLLGQVAGGLASLQLMHGISVVFWTVVAAKALACAFLWMFPATVASKLLRGGDKPVAAGQVPFSCWEELAFVAVGLIVLARAIPQLTIFLMLLGTDDIELSSFNQQRRAEHVAMFVELAIGIWLIFGARGLAAGIRRLRTAGVGNKSEEVG